jgi:hypothetical protein
MLTVHQQQIQATYQTHRTNRNVQQKAKLLSPDFPGITVDEILANLEDPNQPYYKDWRNCLVFWARPTAAVRSMIAQIQAKLLEVAPCKSPAPARDISFHKHKNRHLTPHQPSGRCPPQACT